MSKHTEGPWRVSEYFNTIEAPNCKDEDREVAEWFYQADEGEALANARLIAAAPEMLAMLKRLEWGTGGDLWPNEFCYYCDCEKRVGHAPDCELAALIAKVEGEG